MDTNRRKFLLAGVLVCAAGYVAPKTLFATTVSHKTIGGDPKLREKFMAISEEEWKKRLTPQQFKILRKAGTEPPKSSALNDEKRAGVFHCAGCDNPIFTSETKFESGTGWPSFYDVMDGAIETSRDFKMIWPRTEYHCARCGGHQGHVFEDGPQPTGLRYCNNGVALKFSPEVV